MKYVEFTGDKRTQIMIGHVLTATGKTGTVSSVSYDGTDTRVILRRLLHLLLLTRYR